MKLLRSVVLLPSLFSLSLMAQHGGGHGGGGGGGGFHGGSGGGYSGGGYRGGGGYGYGGGYRGGYGGYYGGYRGYGYGYRGYYPGFAFGFGYGYGYGYPYYYGGGYYDPYSYDPYYYAAPGYTANAPAVAQQTYAAAPAAPAVASSSYYRQVDFYLIAFNDHNIRAATSYHVVGDQIEWTPKDGGAVERAPLSSVDKRFSEQINRDRHVKIELP